VFFEHHGHPRLKSKQAGDQQPSYRSSRRARRLGDRRRFSLARTDFQTAFDFIDSPIIFCASRVAEPIRPQPSL
jgi:hypothetical protein